METPARLKYSRAIERRILSFKEKDKLPERDKELVLKFVQSAIAQGVGERRVVKYFGQLKSISKWLGKDFEKATKEDIERLAGLITTSSFEKWTQWSYKVMIKLFWKWLEGNSEFYPDKVKWIKPHNGQKGKIKPPEDLIKREDLERIIKICANDRDRCIVALLYESGVRIGELLGLRIKDIDFQGNPVKILVDAEKTDTRRVVPLVESVPYITRWLDYHPDKRPESSLFVNVYGKHSIKPMTRQGIYKFMDGITLKLNNGKHIYPHLFRHSRATELANHLTEAQMNKFFGWFNGSDMPSVYVHLSGRDIDSAIMKVYGLENGDKDILPKQVAPRTCPRCKLKALPTDTLCLNCGLPLSPEALVNYQESKDKMASMIEEIIEAKLKAKLEEVRIGIT